MKMMNSSNNNASSSSSQPSGSGGNPNNNPNNNNNNGSDFKIPNNKKAKRGLGPQFENTKELTGFNKEVITLNNNLLGYTKQLEQLKKHHDINYSLDSTGTLSVDVPVSMSDALAADLTKRVGVIDRLYNTQLDTFNSVSTSALAKTEEFKKSFGVDPYTSPYLEGHIMYNRFVKNRFNSLFRN